MNKLIYLVIFSFLSTSIYAQMKDLVQYVNTLQGTDSHFGLSYGNTYPTTGMPYAMHTWSAQTGKNGEGWKYQYAVDNIRGFCQSHQCSPWMSDYAVYSFMPMVGKLVVNQEMRATKFSHDNEIAKPHYYKVMLDNGLISLSEFDKITALNRESFSPMLAGIMPSNRCYNSHSELT